MSSGPGVHNKGVSEGQIDDVEWCEYAIADEDINNKYLLEDAT